MTAKKIDYLKDARHWGLSLVGHELRLVPDRPPRFGSKLPAKTLDGVSACAALNLTYWSEHPERDTVWAADFNGQYHAVHIDKKYRRVKCLSDGRTASWDGAVPSSPQSLFTMLGGEYSTEPEPASNPFDRPAPARRSPRPARRRGSEMDDLMAEITAELDSREVS